METEETEVGNEEKSEPNKSTKVEIQSFKKPLLIGKIGRLPKKLYNKPAEPKLTEKEIVEGTVVDEKIEDDPPSKEDDVTKPFKEPQVLQYKEPTWGGLPESSGRDYCFDVLKLGSIIETVNLMKKSFWVFGRLDTCDITMQHPTVSRYHAILQFRSQITEENEPGFYIYDLGSTHGTFLNKRRIRSGIYVKVSVGHLLKFGCSSRSYILNGPEDDEEEESKFTVTELKQKRIEEQKKREEAVIKAAQEEEERKKREEENGVNWGMGDDADEETDLSENPFAQTNNEELYIDDPKKALRGFMEREGLDLEYDCSEQGMGQYLCKVMLPIDDDRGRPIYAEVLHKGKKKEAVVQCALEACKILDRYGLLRQAMHESRKRKARNWEENDFYDSDDDTFLDRTGTVEKKRENRMRNKGTQQVDTYQSLVEKEKSIREQIAKIEKELNKSKNSNSQSSATEEDSLDSYMKEIKHAAIDKKSEMKLKMDLAALKTEHARVVKLVNITRPANLPPLEPETSSQSVAINKSKLLPVFGKRKKVKMQLVTKPKVEANTNMEDDEEEEDIAEMETTKETKPSKAVKAAPTAFNQESFKESLDTVCKRIQSLPEQNDFGDLLTDIQALIKKLKTKRLLGVDWKIFINRFENIPDNENFKCNVEDILLDFEKQLPSNLSREKSSPEEDLEEETAEDLERKKKKNQRRIQQRENRAAIEKSKGYQEDSTKEDYNMWVPPQNQSGDGRTTLNEKKI